MADLNLSNSGLCSNNLKSMIFKFTTEITSWGIFFLNRPQVNATDPHPRGVKIGSGNGLVVSGNKRLPEPMWNCWAWWLRFTHHFLRHNDRSHDIDLHAFVIIQKWSLLNRCCYSHSWYVFQMKSWLSQWLQWPEYNHLVRYGVEYAFILPKRIHNHGNIFSKIWKILKLDTNRLKLYCKIYHCCLLRSHPKQEIEQWIGYRFCDKMVWDRKYMHSRDAN